MKQSDQSRAQRLLRLRQERAAFPIRHIARGPWLRLAVVAVAGLAAYTFIGSDNLAVNRAAWFVMGIFVWRLIRDWIWLRDVVDGFPFLDKVLDWEAVEKLAKEREPVTVGG